MGEVCGFSFLLPFYSGKKWEAGLHASVPRLDFSLWFSEFEVPRFIFLSQIKMRRMDANLTLWQQRSSDSEALQQCHLSNTTSQVWWFLGEFREEVNLSPQMDHFQFSWAISNSHLFQTCCPFPLKISTTPLYLLSSLLSLIINILSLSFPALFLAPHPPFQDCSRKHIPLAAI